MTVKQFKEQFGSKIGKDPKLMRIRDKNNDKLTKVYHDTKQMEDYNLYEGKQLAIQMLTEPENPGDDELLVMVQNWNPNSWSLTPIKELYVERTCTLPLFAAILCSVYDIPVQYFVEIMYFNTIYIDSQHQMLQNCQRMEFLQNPASARDLAHIGR